MSDDQRWNSQVERYNCATCMPLHCITADIDEVARQVSGKWHLIVAEAARTSFLMPKAPPQKWNSLMHLRQSMRLRMMPTVVAANKWQCHQLNQWSRGFLPTYCSCIIGPMLMKRETWAMTTEVMALFGYTVACVGLLPTFPNDTRKHFSHDVPVT